jgi:tetratricopeptide (TPR) repeat protein
MMMRLNLIAALGVCCFTWSAIAHAQQIKADKDRVAIGGSVMLSTINIGVPPEQLAALVRQAGDLSEAQKKLIAKLEGDLDLNQRQIHAALDVLGEKDVPPERLGTKLVEIAERFKALQATALAQPDDDPRIAALKADAQKAINEGELVRADAILADVETEQRRALDRLAVNAADTSSRRGEIALTRLRYREAAMHFANAAAVFPQGSADGDKRTNYLYREAVALYQQGDEFGDNGALLLAIERFRRLAALTPRVRVLDWAAIQNNLGNALATLGERESGTTKLQEAVAAYREALKEFTRERLPLRWAMTQNNLGAALGTLGERESDAAKLEETVAAYREALKEFTRERAPLDWAMTQNNLGVTLAAVGARESDTAKLEEAVAAYREALKELTRERVPLDWASTESNLGSALAELGKRESDAARLEEAVVAYREALKERTRERVPLQWAMVQDNLGRTFAAIGVQKGDAAKLVEAVDAHREALKETTRERVPLRWAQTQSSLGYAHFYQGDFAAAALDLQEAVDGTNAYPILWLYLARARTGRQDAKKDLEQMAAGLKPEQWPSPVIKLFLEQGTPEAMMAAADKPEEQCEAQYYLGQWLLLRGDRANSIEALRNAVKSCPKDFVEYAGALAELKRLEQ